MTKDLRLEAHFSDNSDGMGSNRKIRFYLVHEETGQRYPISDQDLVIGRSSGDLLFPEDTTLSKQHCRLVMTSEGLGVHDLNSNDGTFLNGERLTVDRVYPLKAGITLKLGGQGFQLQEVSSAKRVSKRRQAKAPPPDRLSQFLLAAIVSVIVIFLSQQVLKIRPQTNAPPKADAGPILSPYEMVDKEVRAAFDQYRQLGRDYEAHRLTQQELESRLRNRLLPALRQVQAKIDVVTPPSELDRRRLEINRKLITALVGQVSAMADSLHTTNPKTQQALQRFGQEVEKLSEQAQSLEGRLPAQTPPTDR